MRVYLFYLFYYFNVLFLPLGFQWSNFLSPLLLVNIWRSKAINFLILLLLLCGVIFVGQLFLEPHSGFIDYKNYVLSSGYFIATLVSGIFFYNLLRYLKQTNLLRRVFDRLLVINAVLFVAAVAIYFLPLREIVWMQDDLRGLSRLKMFYSEPAHYGYILMPLMLYVLFRVFVQKDYSYIYLFIITLLSVLACQSTGTVMAMVIALLVGGMTFARVFYKKYYKQIFMLMVVLLVALPFILDSVLFTRLMSFMAGGDHSGQVRVFYSLGSAYGLIERYNYYFGVGLGQAKEYVEYFTSQYSGYGTNRLPSSLSSTLASIGMLGVFVKYTLLICLFFLKRIYNNVFHFIIFMYALVYGFTGGWVINPAEFMMWALAFSGVFKEYDRRALYKLQS